MRSRIGGVFKEEFFNFKSNNTNMLYVVDYTERTNSVRSVEIHETQPADISALLINNPDNINISTSIFTSHCFRDDNGDEPKQCECVMNPSFFIRGFMGVVCRNKRL